VISIPCVVDGYSDVATTSAGKQSQSRPSVFTSDSVYEDESSEPNMIDHSGMAKVTCGAKQIRNEETNVSLDLQD
jgi:hypothetical protein